MYTTVTVTLHCMLTFYMKVHDSMLTNILCTGLKPNFWLWRWPIHV